MNSHDKNHTSELTKLDNHSESKPKVKKRYTRRQWILFFTFGVINIGAGICYSIIAPFYPEEAESRGVPSTVYGLVFGCFELVDFLVCPIYGRYIRVIGPAFLLNAGNFLLAECTILFGFLDKMPDKTTFVVFSFLIRIVEALGQAAFMTASYAIVAEEFSDNVATVFSILETGFAIGMILGPTTGAVLLEIGGFVFPFLVVGSVLTVSSFIICLIMPKMEIPEHKSANMIKFLLIPSVGISYFSAVSTSFSTAFIFTLLESHLRQFDLSVMSVGVVMVVNGISYACSAPLWGLTCQYIHPKLLCGFAAALVTISFIFIGPAPFIPIDPILNLTIVALVFQGIGASGEYVLGFIDSLREAALNNYPEDIETYAMISGLWTSGFALGSFVGPAVSGVLNDVIGFRAAGMVVVVMHAILSILCFSYYANLKRKLRITEQNKRDLAVCSETNHNYKYPVLNGDNLSNISEILPLKLMNHEK